MSSKKHYPLNLLCGLISVFQMIQYLFWKSKIRRTISQSSKCLATSQPEYLKLYLSTALTCCLHIHASSTQSHDVSCNIISQKGHTVVFTLVFWLHITVSACMFLFYLYSCRIYIRDLAFSPYIIMTYNSHLFRGWNVASCGHMTRFSPDLHLIWTK